MAELDTTSSASRQHFIDTGRYLEKPKHSLAETDLSVGDMIEVIAIIDDPHPPAIGTRGVVTDDVSDDAYAKARIAWDRPVARIEGDWANLVNAPEEDKAAHVCQVWVSTLIFPEDRPYIRKEVKS